MLLYFLYFMIFLRSEVTERTENNRFDANASRVVRGAIVTSDRVAIAYTEEGTDLETDVRVYPYGELFACITGYSDMGRTGLEQSFHRNMMTASLDPLTILKNDFLEKRSPGNNVITSIDSDLQYHCRELLGDYTGSVTVLDPKTGEILAMVTSPSYDPNTVKENWDTLTSSDNDSGNLLNRATQGLYAPGSTFKIITLMEYMRENPDTYQNFTYTCTGEVTVDGETVHCESGAHGELDLPHALAMSCNCAFIEMGMTLDKDKLRALCEELGFNESIISDIPASKSRFTLNEASTDFELMQTVFGQGNTMETPLQNALITSVVANGGILYEPRLVTALENGRGETLNAYTQSEGIRIITEEQAEYLKNCMIACVYEGTSPEAKSEYCVVAGKSGTAQFSSSLETTHAWFTAFAPADDPEIVVTVMLEKAGHGSEAAAPVAREIIDYYMTR